MPSIRDVSIDQLPTVTPAEAHELGMQAAQWLADLTPGPYGTLLNEKRVVISPEKIARAVRYRDTALDRWAASFPPGESGAAGYVKPDPALAALVEVAPPSAWEAAILAAVAKFGGGR